LQKLYTESNLYIIGGDRMKLIVISSSKNIENETKIVTELFEAGLETFHLRKNEMSTRAMKNYLSQIPSHFHNRIFIHSHFKLLLNFDLKGIHLTSKHKKNKWKTYLLVRLIQLKKPSLQITTSFKTLGELYQPKHDYNYDYVFLSPVFDSYISKFQSNFSEYSLKVALSKTPFKVIARGGITPSIKTKAKEIGFYGVAFYSWLWNTKNQVEEFEKITEDFLKHNIPIE
jgi:thiamine-phosphate pyrophosphorylase